jgi:hypothetical protein
MINKNKKRSLKRISSSANTWNAVPSHQEGITAILDYAMRTVIEMKNKLALSKKK